MKVINARGSNVSETILREAIVGTGRKPEVVVMHPEQSCQIVQFSTALCGPIIEVSGDLGRGTGVLYGKDLNGEPRVLKHGNLTIGGIPICQDQKMPPDMIEFYDSAGIISRIENLAIPGPYASK